MANTQSNDATASAVGTLYQLHIAVEKCFELLEGESAYIEKYGDVSIKGQAQIETKHCSSRLTDNHINFWKTLNNWMRADFDHSVYSSLILLTTQSFGEAAQITAWNSLTTEDRIALLNDIFLANQKRSRKKKSTNENSREPRVLSIQQTILKPENRIKLISIVPKIAIAANSPDLSGLYARLKGRFCKHILTAKCAHFLNSLLGYIASPAVVVDGEWRISFDQFTKKVRELSIAYSYETRVFPTLHQQLMQEQSRDFTNGIEPRFLRKIRDIDYADRIPEAAKEHFAAKQMVLSEFKSYQVPDTTLDSFYDEVLARFAPSYRAACLSHQDPLKDSKIFFHSHPTAG